MPNSSSFHPLEIVTSDPEAAKHLAKKITSLGVQVTIDAKPDPRFKRVLLYKYFEILPKSIITQFGSENIINLHNGKLPEYRGLHALSWMIQKGEKIGFLTLHQVQSKVDSGAIVSEYQFPIDLEMDVNDAVSLMHMALDSWLPNEIYLWLVDSSRVLRIPSEKHFPTYPRKHDNNFINSSWTVFDAINILRAVNPPYGPGVIYLNKEERIRVCLPISKATQQHCLSINAASINLELSDGILEVARLPF